MQRNLLFECLSAEMSLLMNVETEPGIGGKSTHECLSAERSTSHMC